MIFDRKNLLKIYIVIICQMIKENISKIAWFQKTFSLKSRSQGCYLITDEVLSQIGSDLKKFDVGMCNVFMPHTSAGLALG